MENLCCCYSTKRIVRNKQLKWRLRLTRRAYVYEEAIISFLIFNNVDFCSFSLNHLNTLSSECHPLFFAFYHKSFSKMHAIQWADGVIPTRTNRVLQGNQQTPQMNTRWVIEVRWGICKLIEIKLSSHCKHFTWMQTSPQQSSIAFYWSGKCSRDGSKNWVDREISLHSLEYSHMSHIQGGSSVHCTRLNCAVQKMAKKPKSPAITTMIKSR